ncbi:hypothetical protein [Guptibacillus hwajinpoensis]|uniref:Uncharacterized protein n=1 Tax=Guptibacillus hwajinpoensis TaxID=208199 RepID=A0A0J6CP19_9BACL|nr:hypothetical protein [Alkalihalobacillus macyae]KMM37986.1 hypothetical protein AB986_01245 [Alkalihalobacillus macyae]
MNKDKLIGLIIWGSIIGISGFVMLFFSVHFGTSIAENWLIKQGGADTDYYNIIVKSYINNFLVGGGILFAVGLATNFIAYYKLQSIKDKSNLD